MSSFVLPEAFFEDRTTAIDVLLDCGLIYRSTGNNLRTHVYGCDFYFDYDYFIDLLWSMRTEEELDQKLLILGKLTFPFVSLFY